MQPVAAVRKHAEVDVLNASQLIAGRRVGDALVPSAVLPITNAIDGLARRFVALRESTSVSNTISKSSDTAMPTTAAWTA